MWPIEVESSIQWDISRDISRDNDAERIVWEVNTERVQVAWRGSHSK